MVLRIASAAATLRLIPTCLTLAFALPAAAQQIIFSPFTQIDPRDPLELSTGTVINGTATILALFEDPDPNELNQFVAFNVPVGDPGSAVSQDVATSSSGIFALSHKTHCNSTGVAFAWIIDDVDANNLPFETRIAADDRRLNWMRTTVASGVDFRSSETGLGPNDEVYIAGLDATNLEIGIFVSKDGGAAFQLHRMVMAARDSAGIVARQLTMMRAGSA